MVGSSCYGMLMSMFYIEKPNAVENKCDHARTGNSVVLLGKVVNLFVIVIDLDQSLSHVTDILFLRLNTRYSCPVLQILGLQNQKGIRFHFMFGMEIKYPTTIWRD